MLNAGARKDIGPLLFPASAPALGFGAWAVGGSGWGDPGDEAERLAVIALAYERGITVFDTASTYGNGTSERLLGRVLRPQRDRVTIATKVGPRDDPRRSLEDSLRRLGTDYVDLVQLHEALERWEFQLEKLYALQEEGKARAVGLCNATHLQIARALAIAPIVSYQAAYNLFDRDVEERELPLVRSRGLAFLAYRPLAAGLLGGKYRTPPAFPPGDHRAHIYWFTGAEFERRRAIIELLEPLARHAGISLPTLALRWLLARDGVSVVLAGARNRPQLEANLMALAGPLPAEVVRAIDGIVQARFRLPRATSRATDLAQGWGPRERFIVERLDGSRTPESIAAEWTDRGETPMVAAQVKVFTDELSQQGLVQPTAER